MSPASTQVHLPGVHQMAQTSLGDLASQMGTIQAWRALLLASNAASFLHHPWATFMVVEHLAHSAAHAAAHLVATTR